MPLIPLDTLLQSWRQLVTQWSRSGSLSLAARQALQWEVEPEPLRWLIQSWANEFYEQLPSVVLTPPSAMPAAAGGYGGYLNTGILLNQQWLEGASMEQALAVLTEGLGHHLDALFNRADTPGDEGELFAALLFSGGSISERQRLALLADQDLGTALLGGTVVAVEQAAGWISTPVPGSTPGRSSRETRNDFAFAALRRDGSVVTWGDVLNGGDSTAVAVRLAAGVSQIYSAGNSSGAAFAALKADGSVVTWGNPSNGGSSTSVAAQLAAGVTQIASTGSAFAALKRDGSVVTWGDTMAGGDSRSVAAWLSSGVSQLFSTDRAFAALKSNGSVVTWGDGASGGSSTIAAGGLISGVLQILSTAKAFAALKADGSVVTWGDPGHGGAISNSFDAAPQLASGVAQLFAAGSPEAGAFAALKNDGSVITWGHSPAGGDSRSVSAQLTSGVKQIVSNSGAFAALKHDGSVVTWGDPSAGGDSSALAPLLSNGVRQISATTRAFAAVNVDGSVITWGDSFSGGNSTAVASDLAAGVIDVVANNRAFAALKSNGSVVTWGDPYVGGDSMAVRPGLFTGVSQVIANGNAFAALKKDGSVVTWGMPIFGGSSDPARLNNVVALANPFTDERPVVAPAAEMPNISLSLSPASVLEDGTANLLYTFTRTGSLTASLTVNYTVGGSATLGIDYTGIPIAGATKQVTFAPGSATAIVTVDPTADKDVERMGETVEISLATATGYTVASTTHIVGYINDDDPLPVVTLAVSPAAVREDGADMLIFTFSRTGTTTNPLVVNYGISGTATFGVDYSDSFARPGLMNVVFAAGSATTSLIIDPTADISIEPDETVAITLNLSAASDYTIGTPWAAVGKILNDDLPLVTLGSTSSSVLEDGASNLIFTFRRTGPNSDPLVVNYIIEGTATPGVDYTGVPTSGTLKQVSFAPGSSTALVTVDPTPDTTFEADESVTLVLQGGTGYRINSQIVVSGRIINDDFPVVSLAVSPASVPEDGPANLLYTFTRTGPTTNSLSVNYTVGGTATLGSDYTGIATSGTSKTVTFAPGSSTALVTVNPTGDITIEPDETVALTLAAGAGYIVGTPTAVVGTIGNDDQTRVMLSFGSWHIAPEDGVNNLIYKFYRTGPTTDPLTVNYTVSGTATLGSDYTGIPMAGSIKQVTIAAGSDTALVTVDPTADRIIEPDETVALTLAPGSGYAPFDSLPVVGRISNDDTNNTLYSVAVPSLPSQQGWLAFASGRAGSQTLNGSGTTLNTTVQIADRAGYSNHTPIAPTLVNPTFPPLDRTSGFSLDFRLRLLSESHTASNRAGFSLTLLDQGASSTPRGIELGFWSNSIFSQAGGSTPFQTIAERVDGVNTTKTTNYSLRILDQRYYLLADNSLLLSGSVQDYSQWPKDPLLPYNPYTTPNFLFLGDNTSSASASVELGSVILGVPVIGSNAPETLTGTDAAESLNGLMGNDLLEGRGGADWLAGGAGNDLLNGGAGDDLLIGGSEMDRFVFSSGAAFNTTQLGVDTIVDFNPAEDRFRLSRATFSALPSLTLSAADFAVVNSDGAAAVSSAVIVYNSANGGVFYNANRGVDGFAGTLTEGGKFAQLWGGSNGTPFPLLTSGVFEIAS